MDIKILLRVVPVPFISDYPLKIVSVKPGKAGGFSYAIQGQVIGFQ